MEPAADLRGLYVHVPFCSVKCYYCDFAAFAGQKRTVARYLAAVEREASLNAGSGPFSTLYVGGGTPSELAAPEIAALFDGLRGAFPDSRFSEVTFEANPESLDGEKLDRLYVEGVTRLSLGLQTSDDALLKSIGRRHTAEDFRRIFRAARGRRGIAISVDLMYGLPGQSLESCLESLDFALDLEPEHVSLYGLQVEDRTLFGKRGVECDEDLGREMFEGCLERLEKAGFRHYEISNFARPGHESRHNMIYWRGGEYLGLGCGASSYLRGERRTNGDRLLPYCESVEKGERPTAESERLEGKERVGEFLFTGLRMIEGMDLWPEAEAAFCGELGRLEGRGLLRRRGRRIALSREGIFLANKVFEEFVPPFAEQDARAEAAA